MIGPCLLCLSLIHVGVGALLILALDRVLSSIHAWRGEGDDWHANEFQADKRTLRLMGGLSLVGGLVGLTLSLAWDSGSIPPVERLDRIQGDPVQRRR